VICPARIEDDIAKKARAIALKVADAFDFVGLLAVELFLTQEDDLRKIDLKQSDREETI
jgi:5-(carboxyamino)imidazole ribonucleotide synthase